VLNMEAGCDPEPPSAVQRSERILDNLVGTAEEREREGEAPSYASADWRRSAVPIISKYREFAVAGDAQRLRRGRTTPAYRTQVLIWQPSPFLEHW